MSRARDFADLAGSADAGGLTGRNLVINGAMQVAQRGTSDSAAAHNSFIVDRFMFTKAGVDDLVVTTSQSTDAPDGFSKSYKIEATTAESALGANDLAYIRTKLEAQNLQHLKYGTSSAEKVTASFWVKSSSAGQYTLTLFQDDGSDLVNKTYSVSSANTWEYKTVTFPAHTTVAIANDNGFGLSLNWIILAGTDYTSDSGAQGAWDDTYANAKWANGHTVTSPFMATNGTFQITGVQLEVGETATPFEHRSYGDELQRCRRYYEQYSADSGRWIAAGGYKGTDASEYTLMFNEQKRVTPTVSFTGTSTDFLLKRFGTSNAAGGTLSADNVGPDMVKITSASNPSTHTTGQASLFGVYQTAKVTIDAEL